MLFQIHNAYILIRVRNESKDSGQSGDNKLGDWDTKQNMVQFFTYLNPIITGGGRLAPPFS